jgi:hypothetical protein
MRYYELKLDRQDLPAPTRSEKPFFNTSGKYLETYKAL